MCGPEIQILPTLALHSEMGSSFEKRKTTKVKETTVGEDEAWGVCYRCFEG